MFFEIKFANDVRVFYWLIYVKCKVVDEQMEMFISTFSAIHLQLFAYLVIYIHGNVNNDDENIEDTN